MSDKYQVVRNIVDQIFRESELADEALLVRRSFRTDLPFKERDGRGEYIPTFLVRVSSEISRLLNH